MGGQEGQIEQGAGSTRGGKNQSMEGKLMLIRGLRKSRCKGKQFRKQEQENQVSRKPVR